MKRLACLRCLKSLERRFSFFIAFPIETPAQPSVLYPDASDLPSVNLDPSRLLHNPRATADASRISWKHSLANPNGQFVVSKVLTSSEMS